MSSLPPCDQPQILAKLAAASRLYLFLDYDGTLADFAPTPENATPHSQVIRLLTALVAAPHIRIAVISGRGLDQLAVLLPVAGILLAGTYGIELRHKDGGLTARLPYHRVRPRLDAVKPAWAGLLQGQTGFFLEDKGWSLALHARFADDAVADVVLARARALAEPAVAETGGVRLQLLGGHKFLEIAPVLADKGETVEFLLSQFPWEGALPVYVGDDDKDEKAFAAVRNHGGLTMLVARKPRPTLATCRLPSPSATRAWLERHFVGGLPPAIVDASKVNP